MVRQLTHIFRPVKDIEKVVSEKGIFVASSKDFPMNSCFHFIETDPLITDPNSILLCDDANDEWCDFLEIDTTQPRMRWLHAKVQSVETPASIADRVAAKNRYNNMAERFTALGGKLYIEAEQGMNLMLKLPNKIEASR